MNEEIKKEFWGTFYIPHLSGCEITKDFKPECSCRAKYDLWNWIDQKLKEQYLQGVTDFAKWVGKGFDAENNKGKDIYSPEMYARFTILAQQFIDSLEKNENKIK